MSSIWDNIAIKNISGVQSVTNAEKNATIESAVTTWTNMGLTQEQIAFGIATMVWSLLLIPRHRRQQHLLLD